MKRWPGFMVFNGWYEADAGGDFPVRALSFS
jgi:hypothetical protein